MALYTEKEKKSGMTGAAAWITVICSMVFVGDRLIAMFYPEHQLQWLCGLEEWLRLVAWVSGGPLFFSAVQVKSREKAIVFLELFFMGLFLCGYPLANLLSGNLALALMMDWILLMLIGIAGYEEEKITAKNFKILLASELVVCALGFPQGLLFILVLAMPGFFFLFQRGELHWKQWLLFVLLDLSAALCYSWICHGFMGGYSYYRTHCAAMYSNLWSDYGFLLFPLVLFVAGKSRPFLGKDWKVYLLVVSFVTMLFCLGSSILLYRDSLDGHNLMYLIWEIIFYAAARGIAENYESKRSLVLAYVSVFAAVLLFMLGGMEERLFKQNIWFCTDVKADSFLKVYGWNQKVLQSMTRGVTPEMEELYEQCRSLKAENAMIPCITEDDLYGLRRFYEQTAQEDCWRYMYQLQPVLLWAGERQQEVWENYIFRKYSHVTYVMVEKNSTLYWYGIGMYSRMEIVYENAYGMILKIMV